MLSATAVVQACGGVVLLINMCLLVAVIVKQGDLAHKIDQLKSSRSGGEAAAAAGNAVARNEHSIHDMDVLPTAEHQLANCEQGQRLGLPSGVTTIHPAPGFSKRVRCDQETWGGGWTVLLHRQRQPQQLDFLSMTTAQREQGFGDPSGEYFAGLQAIHELTQQEDYQLLIYAANMGHKEGYLHFGRASVAGPPDYKLDIGDLAPNSSNTFKNFGLPGDIARACLSSATNSCTLVLNPTDSEIRNEPIFSPKKIFHKLFFGKWTDILESVATITLMVKPKTQ